MALVRPATAVERDLACLRAMLYEAVAWRPGGPRPANDSVLLNAAAGSYVDGWGRATLV